MKKILFRSYDKHIGCFFYFNNGKYYSDEGLKVEMYSEVFNWKNAEQFTGLLNKNGNKIFEGDILQEDWFHFIVKYDTESARFRLISINHYQYPSWNRGINMEIIGNISETKGIEISLNPPKDE